MSGPVKSRRRYDSSRRREQARETVHKIVSSARDLFVERGYARTSMADIAVAAGVSVETVYAAVGAKAALLHRAWDITIGGDDRDIAYHDRPEVMALRAQSDLRRRFEMQARLFTETARRIMPFQLALQAAAGTEPVAADMLAEIGRQRLAGLTVMAREAAATRQLGVTEGECRDLIWATTDGALWQRLVNERGWTDDQFATWLGRLWTRTLVAP